MTKFESWIASPKWRHVRNAAALAAAYAFRRCNRRTQFIAFTGSSGKTTCRNCLAAILEAVSPSRVFVTRGNAAYRLSSSLLGVRPRHKYALIEIGISEQREMRRRATLVLPDMAVITKVGLAHPVGLPTLEITAREKGRLLSALPPGGVAVLNGADPFVREMPVPRRVRKVLFGDCDGSTARAKRIRSSLEDGLCFVVDTPAGSCDIQVGLYGEHWVDAVLGAIAAALALNIPLATVASALATVRAHNARLQPVRLPNGAIVIRDEYNGAVPSFEAAMRFLKTVKQRRRFVVISEIRHLEANPVERFSWLSERIAGAAEGAVFVGPYASLAAGAARAAGMNKDLVFHFDTLRGAAEAFPSIVGSGDIALIRGRSIDHLTRLVYAQFGGVSCWKTECRIIQECDYCSKLGARDAIGGPIRLVSLGLQTEAAIGCPSQ